MEQTTVWYKSKTIWTGFLILGASLLQHFGVIQVDLSTDATWFATAWGVVQTFFRLITKTPVATKSE